jgi:hypothetical protein
LLTSSKGMLRQQLEQSTLLVRALAHSFLLSPRVLPAQKITGYDTWRGHLNLVLVETLSRGAYNGRNWH